MNPRPELTRSRVRRCILDGVGQSRTPRMTPMGLLLIMLILIPLILLPACSGSGVVRLQTGWHPQHRSDFPLLVEEVFDPNKNQTFMGAMRRVSPTLFTGMAYFVAVKDEPSETLGYRYPWHEVSFERQGHTFRDTDGTVHVRHHVKTPNASTTVAYDLDVDGGVESITIAGQVYSLSGGRYFFVDAQREAIEVEQVSMPGILVTFDAVRGKVKFPRPNDPLPEPSPNPSSAQGYADPLGLSPILGTVYRLKERSQTAKEFLR